MALYSRATSNAERRSNGKNRMSAPLPVRDIGFAEHIDQIHDLVSPLHLQPAVDLLAAYATGSVTITTNPISSANPATASIVTSSACHPNFPLIPAKNSTLA